MPRNRYPILKLLTVLYPRCSTVAATYRVEGENTFRTSKFFINLLYFVVYAIELTDTYRFIKDIQLAKSVQILTVFSTYMQSRAPLSMKTAFYNYTLYKAT